MTNIKSIIKSFTRNTINTTNNVLVGTDAQVEMWLSQAECCGGLADVLEPNAEEDASVERYLRVLAQDESDMACTTVRNGVY